MFRFGSSFRLYFYDHFIAQNRFKVRVRASAATDNAVHAGSRSLEAAFMLIFGNSQKYPDDSAESFIVENLSPYCVLWLSRQSEALGQSRTVILQEILKEWLATHSGDVPDNLNLYVAEVAREAVSEFILHHQEEFLPVHLVK